MVDFDPISARAVLSCHHPYRLSAYAYKSNRKFVLCFLILGGCGYRTLSNLKKTTSKRVSRYLSMWSKLLLTFEPWLRVSYEGKSSDPPPGRDS